MNLEERYVEVINEHSRQEVFTTRTLARTLVEITLQVAEKSFHKGWSTGYAVATQDKDEIVQWEDFKKEIL